MTAHAGRSVAEKVLAAVSIRCIILTAEHTSYKIFIYRIHLTQAS